MANKFLNGIEVSSSAVVDGGSLSTGSTILDIQGSQGQLFSVTNSLVGDLFTVSDISGVPILNVNSSGLVTVDGDQTVDGHIKMTTGSSTGKFAVMSTGVHSSYDFYNNGTSYFNGAVTVDANATINGNLIIDGGLVTIDQDAAGAAFTWKESDGATVAGQLRGYANRGDIYLYSDGVKTVEITAGAGSFIPDLTVNGELSVVDKIVTTAGGSLFRKYVSSWTGRENQDLIYQGWNTNTDDYIYLKVPGNSSTYI